MRKICLLLLLLVAWLGVGGTFAKAAAPHDRPLDHTQNVLILGLDQRSEDQFWRTDTLMVAAIDWEKHQVGLLSVPRDLYVDIPGVGKDRINTADEYGTEDHYPGGGPALISAVLSNTLGIRTQNYVRIKMPALADVIDAMGGITITLDVPLHDYAPDEESLTHYAEISMPAGPNHLDGQAVLRYVRARYMTNDFDRTRRQQQLLWAIRQRLLELNWLSRFPEMCASYQKLIETDLSWWDIVRLAWFAQNLDSSHVNGRTFNYQILTPYVTEQGGAVLVITDRQVVDAWVDGLLSAPPPGMR